MMLRTLGHILVVTKSVPHLQILDTQHNNKILIASRIINNMDRRQGSQDRRHRSIREEGYRTDSNDRHVQSSHQDSWRERREHGQREANHRSQRHHQDEHRHVASASMRDRMDLPLHPMLAEIVNPSPSQVQERKKEQKQRVQPTDDEKPNPYFDVNLIKQDKPRDRKTALRFHQRGKFVSKATEAREQVALDELIKDIAKTGERVGMDLNPLLRSGGGNISAGEEVVSVEWWDAPFVPRGYDGPVDYSVIDHLVQQPAFFEALHLKPINPTPVHLTEAERKKARRVRRLAEQADHQDMIRAGLIPPDPSRTKLSSLPALLAANVDDPTRVEGRVRREVEARHRKHLNANKERKLTPEERTAKTKAKLRRDAISAPDGRIHAVLYKFNKGELTIQEQFKIVANARQLYLCGALIVHPRILGLIVEGGPKPLDKMRRLLLHRISQLNTVVVWEGSVTGHSFCRFDHLRVETDFEVKRLLIHAEQRGMTIGTHDFGSEEREMCTPALANVEHYWTMLNNAINETIAMPE